MKVFVTGANGFIGSHITKALVQDGHYVVAFDLVQPRQKFEKVLYQTGTIMDKYAMRRAMRGCDTILHLAAVLGVSNAEQRLLECMDVNFEGTKNTIEAAIMSDVSYYLFASSSEVLGEGADQAFNEESPLNPKSGYAVAKLACEMYIKGMHAEFGFPYNIVRFFNIYGPGQVEQFVISKFVAACLRGESPQIYGNGEQIRSFCNIKDASKAVLALMASPELHNETFHIGNDREPISMMELAKKIVSMTDPNLEIHKIPFSKSDRSANREIYRRIPDITN